MRKFFGTNGNSAVKTFGKKLDKAFREGKMPGVSLSEKKVIFDRVKKVFTVKGKEATSFELRKFQKEVSNPLRFRSGDKLDPKEVARFEKALGPEFETRYTKQVGSKYNEVVSAEKRLAIREKKQKALEIKKEQKSPNLKKEYNAKAFHDDLRERVKRRKETLEKLADVNDRFGGNKSSPNEIDGKETSGKDAADKASVSNVSVKGFGPAKSGGIIRKTAAPTNVSKMYNFSGIGSTKKQQQSDFQYGGVSSKTGQNSNFEILQKALHKMPQDPDFQYGGQGLEPVQENFDDKVLTEKIPEWDLKDKLDAYGTVESGDSADAATSEAPSSPDIPASSEGSGSIDE